VALAVFSYALADMPERVTGGGEGRRGRWFHGAGAGGGSGANWRGIYDDKGRLIAVMTHNSDLGDSWENADDPKYPARFSALGIRIGVNYIVYAMTH